MKHPLGEIQLYVRSMGKLLRVTAVFDDDDSANRFMALPGSYDAVVAATRSGLVFTAHKGDAGEPAPAPASRMEQASDAAWWMRGALTTFVQAGLGEGVDAKKFAEQLLSEWEREHPIVASRARDGI